MAKEIERKFLVKDMPSIANDSERFLIEQYYISINPEIRLRKVQKLNSDQVNYYMTQKSDGTKVRDEIETEVNESSYICNQEKMIGHMIKKTRTRIPFGNKLIAELDVYHGIDLRVVEVEFKSKSEADAFIPPLWFGEEVTNDKRYKNRNLAIKGKI